MSVKIAINASNFADVARFVSPEAPRYYLNGVCIEPTGIMIATDGHTLLACNSVPADKIYGRPDTNWLVPTTKALVTACKPKRGSDKYIVIEKPQPDSLAVTIRVVTAATAEEAATNPASTEYTLETKLIDGIFPDWRRVLPDGRAGETLCTYAFNTAYLDKFGACVRNRPPQVRIVNVSDGDPAYVDMGRADLIGVIMPCRPAAPTVEAAYDWACASAVPTEPAAPAEAAE